MPDKTFFYDCTCGGQILRIACWNDDPYLYLSIFEQKKSRYGWWNRVRHAWKCLTTGDPFDDEIVLSQDAAKKLIKNLTCACIDIETNLEKPNEISST